MELTLHFIPGCLQVDIDHRGNIEGDELGKDLLKKQPKNSNENKFVISFQHHDRMGS